MKTLFKLSPVFAVTVLLLAPILVQPTDAFDNDETWGGNGNGVVWKNGQPALVHPWATWTMNVDWGASVDSIEGAWLQSGLGAYGPIYGHKDHGSSSCYGEGVWSCTSPTSFGGIWWGYFHSPTSDSARGFWKVTWGADSGNGEWWGVRTR